MPFYSHSWVGVNRPDMLSPKIWLYALVLTTISSLTVYQLSTECSRCVNSISKAHGSVKHVSQAKIR